MAVLKQKEVRTVRLVKKETTLPQDVWSMVSSYIKYAGIKGSQVDKRNFVVEGALKHLFESDKGFMEYIGKEAAVKREVATTIEQPKNKYANKRRRKKDGGKLRKGRHKPSFSFSLLL